MASGGASPAPSILGMSADPSTSVNGLSKLNPENIISTTVASELSLSVPDTSPIPQTKICVFCGASQGKSPAHMVRPLTLTCSSNPS
jgi:hypothetical protein